MNIYMIDGIGPFFEPHPKGKINWSKIPFATLERDGLVDRALFRGIRESFARVARSAAAMGFNAISLDDLAHLVEHFCYEPALRRRIAVYREEFRSLFEIAADAGLKVYLTTDIAYFNRELDELLGDDDGRIIRFLTGAVDQIFRDFPQVEGIIVRFGESDGVDVKGDFLSRPVLRSPKQARRYFQCLLAVCEAHKRNLVIRTWSLGAYTLGDLMWNRHTYDKVFGGLHSQRLIISMKYGETDFFRYVPLCAHFHNDPHHQKLVEFQARREYEGFGEYPSFIGWDYERYAHELAGCQNVVGISVWSQTGGWSSARSITFLKNSSVWNELNVWVTVYLFRHHLGVEEAVRAFCVARLPGRNPVKLLELLKLSSEVIREGLYFEDYARCAVYFRRLRLPPLFHVFWDTALITSSIRTLMRHFVVNRRAAIKQGYSVLEKIQRMVELAELLALPANGLRSQHAFFKILAVAREWFLGRRSREVEERLTCLIREYQHHQTGSQIFIVQLRPSRLNWGVVNLGLRALTRKQSSYRLVDRLVLLRLLSWLGWLLKFWPRHRLPSLAVSQGMGIRHFLK